MLSNENMAGSKLLGIFWGDRKFYIVETVDNSSVRAIPLSLFSEEHGDSVVSDDLHLTAFLQKNFRDARITATQANLSIPASETIIRSFVIPVMNFNEIGSAVEFEAKKYIPFSIKDLAFEFYSLPITENGVKKLRIIFVAVRKDFLDRCSRVLSSAGLTVAFSEPAPMSVARALQSKKIIPKDQNIAILHVGIKTASISFLHEGIVFFIREFPLVVSGAESAEEDKEGVLKNRLLNEVHNSIDFFSRQFTQKPVAQMVVLSSGSSNPYDLWLKEDLNIPVKMVEPKVIVNDETIFDEALGTVSAFGVALGNKFKSKADFNLSKKTTKASNTSLTSFSFNLGDYINTLKTGGICGVVLLTLFALSQFFLLKAKGELDALKEMQGSYADMATDDIESKTDRAITRVVKLKKIPLKSSFTDMISYMTALLPNGFWLDSFNLVERPVVVPVNNEEKASAVAEKRNYEMNLTGKVFMEDANSQVRAVNDFLTKVKKDEYLAKFFTKFNLGAINKEQVQGKSVVSFSLTCASQ